MFFQLLLLFYEDRWIILSFVDTVVPSKYPQADVYRVVIHLRVRYISSTSITPQRNQSTRIGHGVRSYILSYIISEGTE